MHFSMAGLDFGDRVDRVDYHAAQLGIVELAFDIIHRRTPLFLRTLLAAMF